MRSLLFSLVHRTSKLGFSGERQVLEDMYAAVDSDASGAVAFDEFNAWVHGKATRKSLMQQRGKELRMAPLSQERKVVALLRSTR